MIESPNLYIVSLPGLLPEQHGGYAGEEAAQEAVEEATLPHVTGSPVGQARDTAASTTAWQRKCVGK